MSSIIPSKFPTTALNYKSVTSSEASVIDRGQVGANRFRIYTELTNKFNVLYLIIRINVRINKWLEHDGLAREAIKPF